MPAEYLNCVDQYVAKGMSKRLAQKTCAIAYQKKHGRSPQADESCDLGDLHEQLVAALPSSVTQFDLFDGDFLALSSEYKRMSKEDRIKAISESGNRHRQFPVRVKGIVQDHLWALAWVSDPALHAKLMPMRPITVRVLESNAIEDQFKYLEQSVPIVFDDSNIAILEDVGPESAAASEPSDIIMVIEGTALVDEAISTSGRMDPPAYFDTAGNDLVMHETNHALEQGEQVDMCVSHQAALSGALPFARLIDPLWREGDRIKYRAGIFGTQEGKDVALVFRQGLKRRSSIRSYDMTFEAHKTGGVPVQRVVRGLLHGIDLTDYPGISGAGVDTFIQEDDMEINWKEITLEDLKANAAELLAEYVKSLSKDGTAESAASAAVNQAMKALRDENASLKTSLEEQKGRLEAMESRTRDADAKDAARKALDTLLEGNDDRDVLRSMIVARGLTAEELAGEPGQTALAESVALIANVRGGASLYDSAIGTVHIDENSQTTNPKLAESRKQVLSFLG